jgi:hypothetical protein
MPSRPAAPVTLTGRLHLPGARRNHLRLLPEGPATIHGFSSFASIYPTVGCAVAGGTRLAFAPPPVSFGAESLHRLRLGRPELPQEDLGEEREIARLP